MLIKHLFESSSLKLYRATTEQSRYPGKFWTEFPELANRYAKKTGRTLPRKIETTVVNFSRDDVLDVGNPPEIEKELFIKWFNKYYPDMDIEDAHGPYLYEVLYNGETDFPYPTEIDRQYLKYRGYKAVFFEYEGGEKVNSWFIPN